MAQVIWSPKAIQDLDNICTYIAKDSEPYARSFARQVEAIVSSLTGAAARLDGPRIRT